LEPIFELSLAYQGARGTARELTCQLRAAIMDGRIAPGTKLPPTRRAAPIFGVSRNTVAEVYEQLAQLGLVTGKTGSGTYVANVRRETVRRERAEAPAIRVNPVWTAPSIRHAMDFWRDEGDRATPVHPVRGDFRPALVDSRLFPMAVFRRLMSRELRRLENSPPLLKSPQGNQGNYHLRRAIAQHVAVTRAVACDPDEMMVTAGAQQAFDLLARILVVPGETVVAVEDPGYPPMRVPFLAAGARVVPIPVDDEGLRVDLLPARLDVVCVCPSHQFPLGMTMSAERRQALLAFARKHGTLIIEDDYDGEFRYHGPPVAALRAAENADVVAYVGTFSKCMLPSLRLGFMVLPGAIRGPAVTAKNAMDWHCPMPLQIAVAAFIADGHLTRHIRKMRSIYQKRSKRIAEALDASSAMLDVIPSSYGMHLAAFEREPGGASALQRQAAADGLLLHTVDRYQLAPARRGVILGFGAADDVALDLLAKTLDASGPR
jgi:GntR family transcriptional regulator/MocR family aminotransferase